MDHAMCEALGDDNPMRKLIRGKKTMKKMGTETTIIWFMQWTLWKSIQKFKMQVVSRLCLPPHYETICM
jgi:hypothetical protein